MNDPSSTQEDQMNDAVSSSQPGNQNNQWEMQLCLEKLGKLMLTSGSPAGKVKSTLQDIAESYGFKSDIVALPNILILKFTDKSESTIDITTQQPSTLLLNEASELAYLVEQLRQHTIPLNEALKRIDSIQKISPRFNNLMTLLGYVLAVMGLTLRLYPKFETVLFSACLGLIAGMFLIGMDHFPRFRLFTPVLAAVAVSIPTFILAQEIFIPNPVGLIIPPLAAFLPGVILTTAMIELASANLIAGSSRLIYGFSILLLLFVGIGLAAQITGLTRLTIIEDSPQSVPFWAAIIGTTLFGIGNFIRLSGQNKDLFWILLVLYAAMLGQMVGEFILNDFVGAFVGALVLALCSEIIGLSPKRTPAFASQTLAFWFLVPGSSALLSVTRLLGSEYGIGNFGLNELILLIVAISLGILLGTILVEPLQDRQKAAPS